MPGDDVETVTPAGVPGGATGDLPSARERRDVLVLAVGFGLASVPWTYGFVSGGQLPLWPSFVAAASVFAAGGGLDGLARSAAGNLAGIAYAAATLLVAAGLGGGVVALSAVVGGFMFLGGLHALVRPLRFTPATFLGYATLFGVNAAGATGFGLSGTGGAAAAAAASMLAGATIGTAVDLAASRLA